MPVDCGFAADPRILRREAGRGSRKDTKRCTVGGGPCPVDGVPVSDSAGLPACVSALPFARGRKARAEWLESCASEASVVFCFSWVSVFLGWKGGEGGDVEKRWEGGEGKKGRVEWLE